MTDTTHDTELTPRDREMMRRGYAMRVHETGSSLAASSMAAARAIPEPPAYTYSEPVPDPAAPNQPDVRRSDGQWGFFDGMSGRWIKTALTDERVALLAACVPGLIPPKPVPTLWTVTCSTRNPMHMTNAAEASAAYWDKEYPECAPHTVRAYAEVTP